MTTACRGEAHGANSHRMERAEGLLPLLEHCIKTPGVRVIDCPIGRYDS
nr:MULTISPECIES: hypothetical protein [unclassified Pseudomonas]